MSDDLNQKLNGLTQEQAEEIKRRVALRAETLVDDVVAEVQGEAQQAKQATLVAEYKKEMYAHRGQPHKLSEIREKYRQMGLNVYQVSFS